jgi:hypothetical protein
MTKEERAALAEFVKILGELAAERRALVTILNEQNHPDWRERLEQIRHSPEYEQIVLKYEVVYRRMLLDADYEALAHITQLLNEGKKPN